MNPENHPTTPDPGDLPDNAEHDEPESESFDPNATQPGQDTAMLTPVSETPVPDAMEPAAAEDAGSPEPDAAESLVETAAEDAELPETPEPDAAAESPAAEEAHSNSEPLAEPPRIVAETPIGGKAPLSPARFAEQPDETPDAAPGPDSDTEPDASLPAPTALEEPPVEAFDPDAVTQPGSLSATEVRAMLEQADPAVEEAHAESPADEAELETQPETLAPARVSSVTEPSRPTTPTPPAQPEAPVAEPAEWDDDISPELAAVLFSQDEREPAADAAPAEAAESVSAAAPARTAEEPAPAPVAEAPAEPVHITDVAQAGRLPLVAEQHSAPAPDTPLDGKVRYVRIEEPLKNDGGQRIKETWTYFQPARPSLAGRLVQEVKREAITYADGSQRWTYERRYTDRGRDRRDIRANAGGDYVEREDEVSRLDAESGKRVSYREDEQMIFAAPLEEKRGFLSSLLGRDDEPDSTDREWRQATSHENRQARKTGGEALKRGFFSS